LAEEIINALTQIPELKVIARTSAFAFKGKEQDITRIAEALRVRTILEGSVRKANDRIRVTAQLIDASDGSHLWSERYDRDMTDVLAIQDEISQAIARKLRLQLSGDRHLVRQPTKNMEAYNLYLWGRYHYSKGTPEGFARSKEYYEQALAIEQFNNVLELDPQYSGAHSFLGSTYTNTGEFDKAIRSLKASAQTFKSNPIISAVLGVAYIKAGHTDGGKACSLNWRDFLKRHMYRPSLLR
jgi:tetratricopeptide (TPR) repeat protein